MTAQEKYGKYSADFIRTDESDAKRIYLTFDEGYENGATSQILDVLKEKTVRRCSCDYAICQTAAGVDPTDD